MIIDISFLTLVQLCSRLIQQFIHINNKCDYANVRVLVFFCVCVLQHFLSVICGCFVAFGCSGGVIPKVCKVVVSSH